MRTFRLGRKKRKIIGVASLFIVALFFSILSQLPANWLLSNPIVKSTIEQKINLTQNIKILASRGTVWQGEVDLAIEQKDSKIMATSNVIPIGKVSWDLQIMSLFITKLSADISWEFGQSVVSGELSTRVFSSIQSRKIHLSGVSGVVNLKDVISKLPVNKITASPIAPSLVGLVSINHLETEYLVQTKWFRVLQSAIQIDDLVVMNNKFPTVNLQVELQDERIQSRLDALQAGWKLDGVASLNKSYAYRLDLNLKADSEKELPDWAFLMQRKSAVNYVAKLQGRLF
ncbi:hypothetical protein THMIRHAM_21050 [Thiomicrorhabdus immobilis]|uniref:Type II secretion system protein N n=1 Tax=Thiomicrorhabdus immobilis TaxID=2791037 RepID=A0ABM7MFT8_9GAMM|nr:type II secretion system protein N [Thiomicrorhabdus immobilis]BCN94320.1 hypothetical protein THMIRHAM_21050 [Thiomicrorhabdus immobilis]